MTSTQMELSSHRIRRRPEHRPLGVGHRQADAMARGKNPRREMHLDLEREDLPRLDRARLAGRLTMGTVEAGASDLGDGAVRGYI